MNYDYQGRIYTDTDQILTNIRKKFPEARLSIVAAFGIAYDVVINYNESNEKSIGTIYYEFCDDWKTRGRDYFNVKPRPKALR